MPNDNAIELLLNQLEKTNQNVKQCQTYLTILVVVCIVAIVIMFFLFTKGKGIFTRDKIIIGDINDKDELHREVMELKEIVKELKANQKIINYAKR